MQYAAVTRKVTIVGPSTLSAIAAVIVQGLRHWKSKKIPIRSEKHEQLSKHLMAHNGYMQKLGSSLGIQLSATFNTPITELGKIDKERG